MSAPPTRTAPAFSHPGPGWSLTATDSSHVSLLSLRILSPVFWPFLLPACHCKLTQEELSLLAYLLI